MIDMYQWLNDKLSLLPLTRIFIGIVIYYVIMLLQGIAQHLDGIKSNLDLMEANTSHSLRELNASFNSIGGMIALNIKEINEKQQKPSTLLSK